MEDQSSGLEGQGTADAQKPLNSKLVFAGTEQFRIFYDQNKVHLYCAPCLWNFVSTNWKVAFHQMILALGTFG